MLRSYAGDGVVTATFKAWPEHDNGFGYLNLNGGIICTVLDCHRAAAVTLEAGRRGWPPPVSYTHLRAHETPEHLVCRLLLEQKTLAGNNFYRTEMNHDA